MTADTWSFQIFKKRLAKIVRARTHRHRRSLLLNCGCVRLAERQRINLAIVTVVAVGGRHDGPLRAPHHQQIGLPRLAEDSSEGFVELLLRRAHVALAVAIQRR